MRESLRTPLTPESALGQGQGHACWRKSPSFLWFFFTAQVLLSIGCVVPLDYQEEEATSANYPPIIRSANPTMGFSPTVIEIDVSNPPVFSIDVEDKDVDDTLFVRVLRDYDPASPTPPVFPLETYEPTGETTRTLQMPTAGWCPSGTTTRTSYLFDVIAADGPFDNTRPFHNVVAGADSSTRAWRADCVPGSGT